MGEHRRGTQPKEVRSSLHFSSMLASLPGQTSRSRAARQQSKCRARAHTHACPQTRIMQHHVTTHSRPHAQAQEHATIASPIAAGCSHHFPASQAGAEQPRHKHTLPKRTNVHAASASSTAAAARVIGAVRVGARRAGGRAHDELCFRKRVGVGGGRRRAQRTESSRERASGA